MFSHKGLDLESETLEYAWLVEAVIGDITGKLTSPQVSGEKAGQVKGHAEPVREKTSNLYSDQVRHKLGCAVTSWKFWI